MFNSIKRKLRGSGNATNSPSARQSIPEQPPRADMILPRRERRRSSIVREEKVEALSDLAALQDCAATKRETLFRHKLQLCSVVFNFDVPTSNKRGKELKRVTLLELVDYVGAPSGQKIFTESIMPDVLSMVSANIFRDLPPQTEDFDPEEDEPVLDPAWPHLQIVYEFLLRFIVSSEVKAKVAKRYIDQRFCLQLIELFDVEDPREREYLKTILHRIYGKFMSHRSYVRKGISNVFYRFVYETERHNGIAELLEILGSIINGFAMPLKKEHVVFLEKALIPLHRPKTVRHYHQQLSYCISQYAEKDTNMGLLVIHGLLKFWPWTNSAKQVLFLNELEDVLELIGIQALEHIYAPLFRLLGKCVASPHFQVAERALFFWNNEHLLNHGCLSQQLSDRVLPIVYGPLVENAKYHWNPTVETLAKNVIKHYSEIDPNLFQRVGINHQREQELAEQRAKERAQQWEQVEQLAHYPTG